MVTGLPPGPAHGEVTMSKHDIVALFLLGSLALVATTVASAPTKP